MEGKFIFGFWSQETLTASEIDPTIGQFHLRTKTFDYEVGDYVTVKEIELASISRENDPKYFYEGGPLNNLIDTNGLLKAKDFSDVVLQDNFQAINGTFVAIELKKCTNSNLLPSGQTCASKEEVQDFFDKNLFVIFALRNFIDY